MTEWPKSRLIAAQYQSPFFNGIGFAKYASTGTVTPDLWKNIERIESDATTGAPEVEGWAEDMVALRAALKDEGVGSWTHDKVPPELAAGVNWWLDSDPAHSEDVVMVAEDGQDALILSGFNSADKVAWVNPDGTVKVATVAWRTVHIEDEEED